MAQAQELPPETQRKVYQLKIETSIPETEFGTLQIDSTPAGAEVCIDGLWTGYKTPLTLRGVRRGKNHGVKLRLDGYKVLSHSFLMDGSLKSFSATLQTK